jgi:hypothetical protein
MRPRAADRKPPDSQAALRMKDEKALARFDGSDFRGLFIDRDRG